MSSWYTYLIVNIAFSHLSFWGGNLFLIVPFPDLRLLVLFTPVVFFSMKIDISIYFKLPLVILAPEMLQNCFTYAAEK